MTNPIVRVDLSERYRAEHGTILMTGVQALVRLPLDVRRRDRGAGARTAAFISGYEGSPLGGYDLELSRCGPLLDDHDIVFQPGLNEELAATAVQGTQLATDLPTSRFEGVTGYWYGKSPGLDRAADSLRHANLGGTHPRGGAVALVGDDPAAKSSTVPGASEYLLADVGMPILYPSDPQDVLDLGIHAVHMSRVSGLWVAMKIVTNVADSSGMVDLSRDRLVITEPDRTVDGARFEHSPTAQLLQPRLTGLERTRNGARLELARRYATANGLNRFVRRGEHDRVGIVAAGKTFRDVRQALQMLGVDDEELARRGVRLLRLGMVHPLDPGTVKEFAAGLREIIVVEEKRSFLEVALRDLLYGRPAAPAITGKRDSNGEVLIRSEGELDADSIAEALARRLVALGDFPSVEQWHRTRRKSRERIDLPLVRRTPYFCSGCPHNVSTKVPDGSLVSAGIGCHGLVLTMESQQVGEVLGLAQMGGEGAYWFGMSHFVGRRHLLQNIGDGTFHHSGSLAVRAAVAAGVNITFKLLYNSAVAMTGGQQAIGNMTVAKLTHAVAAEGVVRIIVTTEDPAKYRHVDLAAGVEVWERRRLIEAQETLAATDGVTILIHDQECATELRRKRKRDLAPAPTERIMINERVCEGCGDCGAKSNCLSVVPVRTEFGRKTRIDQSSCNSDYSCLDGDCPSFLSIVPAAGGRGRPTIEDLDQEALPAPPPSGDARQHTTRILGVGGSGVVTLSQILCVAAANSGWTVASLDQTGLAQKGGAVVSDIKISKDAISGSNKSARWETDLYLAADILVGADPTHLEVADPGRTVAVVSTTEVPTGRMVSEVDQDFPPFDVLRARIDGATRSADAFYLDARRLSEALFGRDQFANILLVGAALQRGALPISAAAIEDAIAVNGMTVEQNVQAFRRGRQAVADPEGFAAALAGVSAVEDAEPTVPPQLRSIVDSVAAPRGSELERLIKIRVPDLAAYHNREYAETFADFVTHVRKVEAAHVPGSLALTEAVARQLHRLMAYKDEYEVARLSVDPAVHASVEAQFGPGARISYRLHPPVLRALGMKNKLTLGPAFTPALRLLARLKWLRGTRLDPFGYTNVRRVERELVVEYRAAIEGVLHDLRPETIEHAVRIADLPGMVRGYEEIKLANVVGYRMEMEQLRSRWRLQHSTS